MNTADTPVADVAVERRAARHHCRQSDPDAFFAAQFLPASQRPVAYAVSALAMQLDHILTSPDSCDAQQAPDHDHDHDHEHDHDHAAAQKPCAGAGSCGGQGSCGGGGCSGFGTAERMRVCQSVLRYLWGGERTGKPELDAAARLAQAGHWSLEAWEAWCRGVVALQECPRVATWRRLRQQLEGECGTLARIVAQSLAPAWQPTEAQAAQLHAWAIALRLPYLLAQTPDLWRRGRLWLPLEDLLRHELSEHDIAAMTKARSAAGDARWVALVDDVAQRVTNLYRGGIGWLQSLPAPARRALAIYGELHMGWFAAWQRAGADPFAAARPRITTLSRLRRVPAALRVAARA